MNVKDIIVALKGFGMGAANVVPGVSGGTIALLTGIYQEIVDALSSFSDKATWKALVNRDFKGFWTAVHGRFLLALAIGVIASIFSLAKLMTWALDYYPILTWAFFFGLILASVFYMLRDVKGWSVKDAIVLVGGIALGLAVCTLSPKSTPDSMWFIFICAAIAICTMILPGISGSFILVILGKYDFIMKAVSDLNVPVLVVFALGCVVGLLAFARFLHWLLARWEKATMLALTGFVIGSLVKVWPWSDIRAIAEAQMLRQADSLASGAGVEVVSSAIQWQIPGAVLWCAIGIILVVVIESLSKKHI